MAVTTTPLGFQKPDGNDPISNGDNVIAANAQKAEDLHATARARLANLDNAAGFTGDPLALNDAAVAEAVKNGTASHAELDARLAIQNPPIVADIIAKDPTVANSAATMAQNTAGLVPVWKATTSYTTGQRVIAPNGDIVAAKTNFTTTSTYAAANWTASTQDGRIGVLEEVRREAYLLKPSTITDSRTAVNARIPFKIPYATTKYRVHIRNRNPETGVVVAGALSFTGVGIGTAQTSGASIYPSLVEASASVIKGSFSTPADGTEYVTDWKTDFPLTPGTVYHLTYGYNGPAQANYAGTGTAFTNNAPTGSLSKSMTAPVTAATAPLDIWVEAITDSGSTKTVPYVGITPPPVIAEQVIGTSSRTAVTAFGDSLTDGGANGLLWPEADSWPSKLDVTLTTATVTNLGFSGATVDEMLMRVGALPIRVTVPAGGVPAGGNAFVTPLLEYGMPGGVRAIDAAVGGVGARLNKNADGTWQLYNYGAAAFPAGITTVTPTAPWAGRHNETAVIWIGINDITGGVKGSDDSVADHVVGGTQKLIEWFSPQVKHYMILGVTTRTNETTGTPNHTIASEINERLRTLYPGHFKSVQAYLRGAAMSDMGVTPSQQDTDNIAAGTLPPSVLEPGDIGHISKAAATVVANKFVAPYLRAKGWVDG